MNILYLCHRFPYPPKRGGKIRPFNMIRHFTARGHRVTVCSLARSLAEAGEGGGIAPYCADFEMATVWNPVQVLRMVVRLPLPTPSSMGFFHSRDLGRRIHALLAKGEFDLIFVHCSSVAHYVEDIRGIPKILDFGDMDSCKWLEYAHYKPFPLSLGYWLEGVKMGAAEKRLAGKFDLCTATTRTEWQTLEQYGTALATGWFPNGVDTEYFKPDNESYDPDTLTFIGRMDYYPNQECMFRFCREVWPLILSARPAARLLIVGADPNPAVRKLEQVKGVTVTGSVSDVRPYVLRSAAMVAPLNIARGTQNKILEALAMGVPVVSSSIAAGGVDAENNIHFRVADSPPDFARACLDLMGDPTQRARFSEQGRERMLSHHDWKLAMGRLDTLVERTVSGWRSQCNLNRIYEVRP